MTPEREIRIKEMLINRQSNLTVVLENVEDPHNIAAVLRTCDAVGIPKVYVLNTRIPRHKKFGDRSSSSANKWVQVEQYTNIEECIKVLKQNFDIIICAHLTENSNDLYRINFTQKIAIVFGNETDGVSEELKNLCDYSFIIPQMGMLKSLNISVACAVTIYEALRQKRINGDYV